MLHARRLLGTVAASAALALTASGLAVADTLTADGDTASATNDVTVTDCASGVTRADVVSTGVATVLSGGGKGNQFLDGTTVKISSSAPAANSAKLVTSGGGDLTVPSGWTTSTSTTMTKSIGITVKAGLASGSYPITVVADGYRSTNSTNPLQITATYNVVVSCPSDTTAPQLTLPANISTEATGAQTPVSWTATATDAVDGSRPVSCTPASGSSFPVGTTTVSCSASDLSGNTARGSFTVTVTDHTAPTLVLPASSTHEATGPDGAAVTYTASASDLVDGTVSPTCAPASGATFPVGTTTVRCSATDAAGNTSTGSFTVAVGDKTAPVVSVPTDRTVEATGPDGAVQTWTATAKDTVDGDLTPTCTPASGATFALGTATVTCSATDAHANTGSASFAVTVEDTTPPVLAGVPATQVLEATGPGGAALASFGPTATDLVTGSRPVTCTAGDVPVGAGFSYPLDATTTVTCSSTDGHGNTATAGYAVKVVDTTGPVLHLPSAITAEATSAAGAAVDFTATATDAVDGTDPVSCVDAQGAAVTSGQVFPLGSTAVSCSATDAHRNPSGTSSFSVTVADTTPPVIAGHDKVGAEATSAAGAVVGYTAPSTTDAVDGSGTASCAPASGSTFALGTTTVTCGASDAAGNAATPTTFAVEVVDTTAPSVDTLSDSTAEATSAAGTSVFFAPPASHDLVDGDGTSTCSPESSSTFPLGTTTVTCSATDAHGNTGSSTFKVTVRDTTGPTIAAHDPVTATATSSSGAVVTYTSPAWTDAVSGSGTASCLPASGSLFPVGASTVTCTASDAAGNTSSSRFTVTVGFGWHGFFQPIDVAGGDATVGGVSSSTVFNKVKAGSTVPVKFDLSGNMGLGVLASGYPKTTAVTCSSSALTDAVEETSTAATGLKYDATTNAPYGQYVYTWKTPTAFAGTCQRLEVKLVDGSSHYAFFTFTK